MNNEKYTLASLPPRGQRYFYVTWDKKQTRTWNYKADVYR